MSSKSKSKSAGKAKAKTAPGKQTVEETPLDAYKEQLRAATVTALEAGVSALDVSLTLQAAAARSGMPITTRLTPTDPPPPEGGNGDPPVITSLDPPSAPVDTATDVGINGTGFDDTCTVTMNGNPILSNYVNEWVMVANIPGISEASAVALAVVKGVAVSNELNFIITAETRAGGEERQDGRRPESMPPEEFPKPRPPGYVEVEQPRQPPPPGEPADPNKPPGRPLTSPKAK